MFTKPLAKVAAAITAGAALAMALGAVPAISLRSPPTSPPQGPGALRVIVDPSVRTQVLIDGRPSNSWGTWVTLPAGTYQISFTDVPGFTTPAPQSVTVVPGMTQLVIGAFGQRGFLRVITDPAVPGTIIVDGTARNDWGMWTDVDPGVYEVCFGPVPGRVAPPCRSATVVAGSTALVIGSYG